MNVYLPEFMYYTKLSPLTNLFSVSNKLLSSLLYNFTKEA